MLTAVEVVPPPGASFEGLVLPVTDAAPDAPIVVRHVDGLTPVDAEVNSKGYGQVDGEYYVGSRIGKRNVVLTLGINDHSVALPLLYAYFMTTNGVTLKFHLDGYPGADVYIDGFIETFPYDRWTQDPEVQISILCPKPNFHKYAAVVSDVSGSDPDPVSIEYQGNRITGFEVTVDTEADGYIGDIFLEWKTSELALNWRSFGLENIGVAASKTMYWSSVQGNKRVEMHPLDVESPGNSLLWAMNDSSFWLTLWPGTNLFRVRTSDGSAFDWSLTYSEKFGGI